MAVIFIIFFYRMSCNLKICPNFAAPLDNGIECDRFFN